MVLQVIGAGFGRTGTNSLKVALEQLGFGPCHHMFEVRNNPATAEDWIAVGQGGKPDWEHMFQGYQSSCDWPSARFWRELADFYPAAKVILSVRDPEAWYRSVENTILPDFDPDLPLSEDPMKALIPRVARAVITHGVFGGRVRDRDHMIKTFIANTEEVRATIAAERLLVFEARDGWEPLCAFLGVEVPSTPYPSANSTENFKERRNAQ